VTGSDRDWGEYYDEQGTREPRELLLRALAKFEREGTTGQAVDLGCGQGFETAELVRRGWTVVAIDGTEEGIRRLRERVGDVGPRLRTVVSRMEDAEIPSADLVHASFSLPYCRPEAFPRLWGDVRAAIRPGGRFCGQIFGLRDTWAGVKDDMTFFDEQGARALFEGMELEELGEQEDEAEAWGEQKHWHWFDVLARRPG
jgi:SAM-dependent methyltransferase